MSALGSISIVAVGARAKAVLDEAAGCLRETGFEIASGDVHPGRLPLVVLFDAVDDTLVELLGELVGGRGRCLIAIACDRVASRSGTTWRIVSAGASDVFSFEESPEWPACVAARVERWRRVETLARSPEVSENLVGESRRWQASVRAAIEAACFTDAPVVLTGETGTGKERVARLIHALDPRPRKAELILLDCTTIVPTLSGSEFFGHERGAFTGATIARDGAFALANGGTLFLDEVGELPLPLQSELLRVVQEGAYKRVGGNDWRTTSFRLVCATNRDLFAEAAAGRFRYDFLYRLAGSMLHLPSLAERSEDIIGLARHFLSELGGGLAPRFEPEVEAWLIRRDYPGNVRELRQLMGRIAYRHVGPGPITVGDVPEDEREVEAAATDSSADDFKHIVRHAVARGLTLREIAAVASDAAISVALADENGNLQRAARRLGVTPRALQLRRASGRLPPAATRYELPTSS